MKRKIEKRLGLTLETLRQLDGTDVSDARGAVDPTTNSLKCSTATQELCSGCQGCGGTIPRI